MLARIAQELFWLGRDLSRAEHTARMIDGAFHADVAGRARATRGIALSWEGVLATIGAKPPAPARSEPALPSSRRRAAEHRGRAAADARHRQPRLGRLVRRPRARARAHDARRDLDRDVGGAQLVPPARSAATTCRPRCGPARTPSTRRSRSTARCSGGCVDGRCCATRPARSSRPAAASRRPTWSCGCCAWRSRRAAARTTRLRDRGAGAAARRRRLAGLPPRRPRTRPTRRRRSPASCSSTRTYPGSVASSVEALRGALAAADAQPRSSPPVLRLGRLIADLELQRARPGRDGGELIEILRAGQDELELVDRDIDDRYFAIAALAAVHL